MFGDYKVKIEGDLLGKLKIVAEAGGFESVDEFVIVALEREVAKLLPHHDADGDAAAKDKDKEAVKKRLQGLGYIE